MLADSVMESSSTTGTGSYTLVGAVGYSRTFAQDFTNGDTVAYFVSNLAKTKWELCTGTLTIGPPRTLGRTVRKSSNAGAAIDWQASDVYYVFSIASADALAGLLAGNLSATTRPWWVRIGGRWLDSAAGLAVSWIDKLAIGASADTRIGIYDAVKAQYFPDARRPWTAVGAANKSVAAADVAGIFTFDNAAAGRTMTLPLASTTGVGHGFLVGGLGTSSAYPITVTPNASDAIEAGTAGASRILPGGVRFDLMWDGASSTWRVIILGGGYPAGGVRQTVMGGPVDSNGLPSFLPATASGLAITSQNVAATAPLVFGAAGGFGYNGRVDRIAAIVANVTWSSLTNTATNYLYVDLDGQGGVTTGATTTAPAYQEGGTYAVTSGVWTFNVAEMVGKLGNGSAAAQVWRVFVGEAVTSGGNVTSTVSYAYNGRYESAFSATLPGPGTLTTAAHNIGVVPRVKDFSIECTTADRGYAVGDTLGKQDLGAYDGANEFPVPLLVTAKTIAVTSGASQAFNAASKSTGSLAGTLTLANWKYRFRAERGW